MNRQTRQTQLKKNLKLRAKILQAVRSFFIERQYLEIDTPIRIPAPAPEAHIDAIASGDWFLQTSPELCMKQLLAAGFSKVFQICKCFRHNERGHKHLPELTMLEWYRAGGDYNDLMDDCEDLIGHIASRIHGRRQINYQHYSIQLNKPWKRMSVEEAFNQFASMTMDAALVNDCFDEIMVEEIEPNLGRPVPLFLFDYPASLGALARLKPGNRRVAERFELYIAGIELCNGFSELTDPIEQRSRFVAEQRIRRSLNKPLYQMPENFLAALETMPDACGNALGIDRLVMLFADTANIDDVVAFTPEEL